MEGKVKKNLIFPSGGYFMNRKLSHALGFSGSVLLLCAAVLLPLLPFSCKMTEEGIIIEDADLCAPSILSFTVRSSRSIEIECSEKVRFDSLAVCLAEDDSQTLIPQVSYSDQDNKVFLSLPEATRVGLNYQLSGIISDLNGNSLDFSRPFTGYNDRPARLILSEIRPGASKAKVEYVELVSLCDGNTSGLSIVSGNYGLEKKFDFPPIEVKKGEYITVHMKTYADEAEMSTNEVENDLSQATATDSSSSARDLWNPLTKRCLTIKDVLAVTDGQGNIIDAILYSQSGEGREWKTDLQSSLASRSIEIGLWTGGVTPGDNGFADNLTTSAVTRSLSRKNVQNRLDILS